MRPTSVLLLLGGLVAGPLAADCFDVRGNLTFNCFFDSNISSWTVDSGVAAHTAATGNPNMASLLAGTPFYGNGAISVTSSPLVKISQCLNTILYGSYSYFFAYQADNATEENCRVRALEYNSANCPAGTQVDVSEQTDGLLTGWEWLAGTIDIGPDARSIELEVECDGVGGADASAVFDDGVLQQNFILIDNFETGNTVRWSTVVP